MNEHKATPNPVATVLTPSELCWQVGEWANNNFAKETHFPEFGVLEEIGEIAHCILKRIQRIRGFGDEDHFKKEVGDALADTIVYMAHACSKYECFLPAIEDKPAPHALKLFHLHLILGQLATRAGFLISSISGYNSFQEEGHGVRVKEMRGKVQDNIAEIFRLCEKMAWTCGLELWPLVTATWSKVQQRDWVANPVDADQVADPANRKVQGGARLVDAEEQDKRDQSAGTGGYGEAAQLDTD